MIESIGLALVGGAMIGLAASGLLLVMGRVCGISGMVGGLLSLRKEGNDWRSAFVAGLLFGGLLLAFVYPQALQAPTGRSLFAIAGAGVAVGYGTLLGSGCTSGHGICGLTRFSPRALVATLTFMATGFLTATILGFMNGAV